MLERLAQSCVVRSPADPLRPSRAQLQREAPGRVPVSAYPAHLAGFELSKLTVHAAVRPASRSTAVVQRQLHIGGAAIDEDDLRIKRAAKTRFNRILSRDAAPYAPVTLRNQLIAWTHDNVPRDYGTKAQAIAAAKQHLDDRHRIAQIDRRVARFRAFKGFKEDKRIGLTPHGATHTYAHDELATKKNAEFINYFVGSPGTELEFAL